MAKNIKKSVGAVVAGILVVIVVSTLADIALHMAGFYPAWDAPLNDMQSLVATLYRIVISMGGAYLTAHLAPQNRMKHVLILGYVGTALGTLGVLATWDKGMGPHWYPIALAVLAVPQCWAGGLIYISRHGGK